MQYEYNQIYISFKEDLDHREMLNKMGSDGWELVLGVKVDDHNIMYIFKREKIKKEMLMEGKLL